MKPKKFVNEQTARRNIRLFVVQKIFVKRVFIPITAIYFTQVAGFSLAEIGLVATIYALTSILAELPTGYFADKIARVTSLRLSAVILMLATLLYALVPTRAGIFTGIILEALGYCFLSGAGDALLHDTLTWQNREQAYAKIAARAQSISLVINMVLVALVPMTYVIDKRLPFLIGTVAYGCLLIAALFMREVKRVETEHKESAWKAVRGLVDRKFALFLVVFGLISALYNAPVDFGNLALVEFGLKPENIGWLFAAASGFGALIGPFIHVLKRMRLSQYMVFDTVMMITFPLSILSGNLYIVGAFFVMNFAFWRYRLIIYQGYLLALRPTYYKATMLSLLNNVTQLYMILLPLMLAGITSIYGLKNGLGYVGVVALLLIPLSFTVANNLAATGLTDKKRV